MRVLLVEDQPKTASFIRKALLAEGFAVDRAEDGETALTLARTTPFDAIVLDIMLPGRDGLSVLRVLRERRVTTPVLLLSARGEVSERVDGLNAGADDYLSWPNSSRGSAPWAAGVAKPDPSFFKWPTSR
jgi:DNA-binding response OmpR family regulator